MALYSTTDPKFAFIPLLACCSNPLSLITLSTALTGINISSNVSNQPFNEKILNGAKNRIKNLKLHLKENNLSADYLIAIESGIIEINKIFFASTIALIEDNQGNKNWGTSASFVIPPHLIPQIKETSLAETYKSLYPNADHSNGTIAILTNGKTTRTDLVTQAIEMALTTLKPQTSVENC